MEQYSRRDCVEIKGIPVNQNENTDNVVIDGVKLMDVPLKSEDISISHRLPQSKNSKYHPIIMAKLTSRKARYMLQKLREAKKLVNLSKTWVSVMNSTTRCIFLKV